MPSRKSVAESPVLSICRAARIRAGLPRRDSHLRRTPNVAVWHEVETKADPILEEWYYEPPSPGAAGEEEAEGAGARELLQPLQEAVDPILREAAGALR